MYTRLVSIELSWSVSIEASVHKQLNIYSIFQDLSVYLHLSSAENAHLSREGLVSRYSTVTIGSNAAMIVFQLMYFINIINFVLFILI